MIRLTSLLTSIPGVAAIRERFAARKAYELLALKCQGEFEYIGNGLMEGNLKPSVYFEGDKTEYAVFRKVWHKVSHERLPEYS